MLTLVPTPIGNLKDITLRALEVLEEVDVIYCENKRQSQKLLNHYGVKVRLESYHEHNAERVRPHILELLRENKNVALISDAGMPVVSDPGYKLVLACQEYNLDYTVLPGPSAVLTALIASGFKPDNFTFGGFLPSKKGDRQKLLERFFTIHTTRIFFESPHRLIESLKQIAAIMPTIKVAVCRELTKMYEDIRKGHVEEVLEHYEKNPPKGEIVLVIEGMVHQKEFDLELELREALKSHKTKEAASLVSEKTGHSKKELYTLAIQIQDSPET